MNGPGFFLSIRTAFYLGAGVLAGWVACIWVMCLEISREMTMANDYGDDWHVAYESHYGPLSDGRVRIVAGILGIIVIPALAYGLLRALRPAWKKSGGNRSRRESRHVSSRSRSGRDQMGRPD